MLIKPGPAISRVTCLPSSPFITLSLTCCASSRDTKLSVSSCDGTTRLKSAGLPVSSHVSAWLFAKANGLSFSTVYCMEGRESSNVT